MASRVETEVARILGPAVVKCAARPTDKYKIRSKARVAELLTELGLSSVREAARRIGVDESTLRAWLDPRDLRKSPPYWLVDALGREAHERAAYAHAEAASVNESQPPTGTEG